MIGLTFAEPVISQPQSDHERQARSENAIAGLSRSQHEAGLWSLIAAASVDIIVRPQRDRQRAFTRPLSLRTAYAVSPTLAPSIVGCRRRSGLWSPGAPPFAENSRLTKGEQIRGAADLIVTT